MQAAKRKTRWGRWLLGIILALLLVAYFIIWFVVTKPMIGDFVDTWLEDQRAMGFEIEYSDRRVEGFPLNKMGGRAIEIALPCLGFLSHACKQVGKSASLCAGQEHHH